MVDLVYALNQRDHRKVVALRPKSAHSGQYRRGVVELARLHMEGGRFGFMLTVLVTQISHVIIGLLCDQMDV